MSQVKDSQLTGAPPKKLPEPRPSASPLIKKHSIVLVSPTNQVLLLHRVKTASSFASAHVFPGGNLDAFHDGVLPSPDAAERHVDGPAYRLGALRECFEESGILLARPQGAEARGWGGGALLDVATGAKDQARREVHANRLRFEDWVRSVGGEPDFEGLMPFTRWITPPGVPKRFTTQMYLYFLPLATDSLSGTASDIAVQREVIVPVPDGGLEHTAATFDDVSVWIDKARDGSVIMLPPQCYLLTLLSQFMPHGSRAISSQERQSQRDRLVAFLDKVPTAHSPAGAKHPTAAIPWADKVMSPLMVLRRKSDGRVALGLDKPGPELKGSKRGGDWERVVLVNFTKQGPVNVEVRGREDVMKEERESEQREERL